MSKNEIYQLPGDALLDPAEVSVLTGIPEKTLARWRSTGTVRLPYRKLGKHVRYRKDDVLRFSQETA